MKKTVQNYYESIGCRLGYLLLLKGSQHFGYYPSGCANISEDDAQRFHHDLLAQCLEYLHGMKVLDAGCGQGFVSCDLAQRFGMNVTGIDVTPYIVERARKRAQRMHLTDRVQYVLGTYMALPFPDHSFDRVYTVETLCHATDLKKALQEFHRVLKPGGKIVCLEYLNGVSAEFSPDEARDFHDVIQGTSSPSLPLFARESFPKLLSNAGFCSVSCVDISKNFLPSLERFYRIALSPYFFLKAFGVHRRFVNMMIAVEFTKLARKRLFGYAVYSAAC